jgi:uncharacterized protein YfbU (UPF0304 family)
MSMRSPFTKAECLLLSSHYRSLAASTGDQQYERSAKIVESGYVSLHEELLQELDHEEIPSEKPRLVIQILEMFADIYTTSKNSIRPELAFSGFCDPPEGDELYFAKFVIEDLGRYSILGEMPQAASPMMFKYSKMLDCYRRREDIFELHENDLVRLATVIKLVDENASDNGLIN